MYAWQCLSCYGTRKQWHLGKPRESQSQGFHVIGLLGNGGHHIGFLWTNAFLMVTEVYSDLKYVRNELVQFKTSLTSFTHIITKKYVKKIFKKIHWGYCWKKLIIKYKGEYGHFNGQSSNLLCLQWSYHLLANTSEVHHKVNTWWSLIISTDWVCIKNFFKLK